MVKIVSLNRKAYRDYSILDTVEAGLVLTGTEIKSIRAGRVNLGDAYARAEGDELWLQNAHIAPYQGGNRNNHEPTRPRKLLLHRGQIDELRSKVEEKGLTLVALKMYLKNERAKVELGLARGRRAYDKRQVIAKREAEREIQRTIKGQRRKR